MDDLQVLVENEPQKGATGYKQLIFIEKILLGQFEYYVATFMTFTRKSSEEGYIKK